MRLFIIDNSLLYIVLYILRVFSSILFAFYCEISNTNKEWYIVSIYSKKVEINQEENESYKKKFLYQKFVLIFKKGVSNSKNTLIHKFVRLC